MTKPIYFDYHATTPTDPRVVELMLPYLTETFGNANSADHTYGDSAAQAVSQARQQVAQLIQASPKEIIFTSGATESINLAIQGNLSKLSRVAISPLEHKVVLDTCQILEKKGQIELIYLSVDSLGRIDLEHLEKICSRGLALLCIMAANNEIGNIYPIEKISQIAQKYQIPFLCDASQAVGKISLNFQDLGITYLAISAHKLYGPKGVGALAIKKGSTLNPISYGGGQEKGLRSGTLNVPAIVGLGEACRLRQVEMTADGLRIAKLRDKLQRILSDKIPNLVINGDRKNCLAGNLHISIPNILNTAIIARIRSYLAISTGSACSSGTPQPSHVLRAMRLPESLLEGALRLSLGKFTTDAEVEQGAIILAQAVREVERSFWTT